MSRTALLILMATLLVAMASWADAQDVPRTYLAVTKMTPIHASRPAGAGVTPRVAYDDNYIYIASRDEGNGGRLLVTRCSFEGTACSYIDVSEAAGQGDDSIQLPFLLVTNNTLYVAGSNPAAAHKPAMYLCKLPAVSPCQYIDLDPTSSSVVVTEAHITSNSNSFKFFVCEADGSSCLVRRDNSFFTTHRNAMYTPVMISLNTTELGEVLQIRGEDRSHWRGGIRYVVVNPTTYTTPTGTSYVSNLLRATHPSSISVTEVPERDEAWIAYTGNDNSYNSKPVSHLNNLLGITRCTPSTSTLSCNSGGYIDIDAGHNYGDTGLSPSMMFDDAGDNMFAVSRNAGAGDRLFLWSATSEYGQALGEDLSEAVGRGNGTVSSAHAIMDTTRRYIYSVAENPSNGNRTDLFITGRIPIIIPFFGECIAGCVLGSGGGAVNISVQDFVLSANTITVNGVAPSTLNISVSLGSTEVEVSPFASRRRRLLTRISTLDLVFPPGQEYGFPVITATNTRTGDVQTLTGLVAIDPGVDAGCGAIGQWYSGGVCLPCPTGGVCPGGSRVWPRDGYWSASELEAPVKCTSKACCGAMGTRDECPARELASGRRDTARCAPGSGRTGPLCEECVSPGWYRDAGTCRRCDSQDRSAFAGYVTAAVIIVLVVSLAVAVLPGIMLARIVALVVATQQFVAVGRTASARLTGDSGTSIADVFRVLSVVLFDIEMIQPACYVDSTIDFGDIVLGMLALLAIALTCVTIASLVFAACGHSVAARLRRQPTNNDGDDNDDDKAATPSAGTSSDIELISDAAADSEYSEEQEASSSTESHDESWDDSFASASKPVTTANIGQRIWQRTSMAIMVLAFLVYYQVALRACQAVACQEETTDAASPEKRLIIELSTVCYEGSHTTTAGIGWALLIVFVAGLPLIAFIALTREYLRGSINSLDNGGLWLVASASAGDTKLFVSGLIFCINMVLVGSLLPFKTLLSNLVPIIAGLAAAIQMAVFLSVTDNADHALLHALIAIISISVVVVAAAFAARRAKGNSASADADGKSLSTDDDYTMATASSAASSLSSAVSSISS
ncbi:uncharacterized protein AMSG_08877 [Thecamonas trahens ATCC 50062]|uniref:Uncharacterized protein n=1 Tax=Thecamonas trahens ATCC 50062 TaxID=461836 RepID=A0A0L0DM32_THETB|nr:hypothetical protein AMSG_08877 [Thecamonas trahens ATCC 50062]KNC53372.1 hypothetical protein AMSG_08877 [Thecamonas trahens ATCC 50062]|eukprot:XP_013754417.1 hypothetical protein AMSG_08877 [Thecamonas trahens ATCC 50062]